MSARISEARDALIDSIPPMVRHPGRNRKLCVRPAPVEGPVRSGPGDGHSVGVLEMLFEACFLASHNTRLQGGGAEPLYRPADRDCAVHRIVYRADYFASALHEIAHWCIAGVERRQQVDYGYWYCPDGRDSAAQRAFEAVEARPQALEWILATAAGHSFRISLDNLGNVPANSAQFCHRIVAAARHYCRAGLPPRAAQFVSAVAGHYGVAAPTAAERYTTATLMLASHGGRAAAAVADRMGKGPCKAP